MRVLAVMALVGCAYTPPTGETAPMGDGPAVIPDGPTMCPMLFTECAAPATLRTCATVGKPSFDTPCNWGCLPTADGAKCGDLLPAGGGVQLIDLTTVGLGDIILDAGTIDDNTGAIAGPVNRGPVTGLDK